MLIDWQNTAVAVRLQQLIYNKEVIAECILCQLSETTFSSSSSSSSSSSKIF